MLSKEAAVNVTWNINLGTVLAVLIPLAGAGIWVNTQVTELNVRVSQMDQFRAQRTAQTDKTFADLGSAIHALEGVQAKQSQATDTLSYRMGQIEASVSAINARMDRLADSVLSSVEGLKKDVSGVNTQVQLLGQKVDSLDVPRNPTLKRGSLIRPLWFEERTRSLRWKIVAEASLISPSPP